MPIINMLTNVVKGIFVTLEDRKTVSLQNNNLYTTGNNNVNIKMVTPYGYFCIPKKNANNCMIPINDSPKGYVNIGFINSLSISTPINITDGEFVFASDNWALTWNNDGLNANKLDNSNYFATLISGQWVNYLMLNRITEIENMINEINNNYTTLKNTFNAHIHSGVQTGGGNSGTSTFSLAQTNLPIPATLNDDTNYINNENDLLNDNAIETP